LEVRRLFLPRNHIDFDFLEAGRFEPAVQITFRNAPPAVTL
jgi:hypothetical protein